MKKRWLCRIGCLTLLLCLLTICAGAEEPELASVSDPQPDPTMGFYSLSTYDPRYRLHSPCHYLDTQYEDVTYLCKDGILDAYIVDFTVEIDGKPYDNIVLEQLGNTTRYYLRIKLPKPSDFYTPMVVTVKSPYGTDTLELYTSCWNSSSEILFREVINGQTPENAVLSPDLTDDFGGIIGETKYVVLMHKSDSGYIQPFSLNGITNSNPYFANVRLIRAADSSLPDYLEIRYWHPGITRVTLDSTDRPDMYLDIRCGRPALGLYASPRQGEQDLIIGEHVSVGKLQDGDLWVFANNGMTMAELQQATILVDGTAVPINGTGEIRAEAIPTDLNTGAYDLHLVLPPVVGEQIMVVDFDVAYENEYDGSHHLVQRVILREEPKPWVSKFPQFVRTDRYGEICTHAYPMNEIRVPIGERLTGVLVVFDQATRDLMTARKPTVTTGDGYPYRAGTFYPEHPNECWFEGCSLSQDVLYFSSEDSRENWQSNEIPIRVTVPRQGLFCAQERNEAYFLTENCSYLELPAHEIWYMDANGLTAEEAAGAAATLEGAPLPTEAVASLVFPGRYDLKLSLPATNLGGFRTLELRVGEHLQRLTIDDAGYTTTPGIVVRNISVSQYGAYPERYDANMTEGQTTEKLYQFFYTDGYGHIQELHPDSVTAESEAVLVKPSKTSRFPDARIVIYDRPGSTNLVISGTDEAGQSYLYKAPITVLLPTAGLFRTRVRTVEGVLDGIKRDTIAYSDLENGEFWMLREGGFTDAQRRQIVLRMYGGTHDIPEPGEQQPEAPVFWEPREEQPTTYDLHFRLPPPVQKGTMLLQISFNDADTMGLSLTILGRETDLEVESLQFRPAVREEWDPVAERELVLNLTEKPELVGSFWYHSADGTDVPLTPTRVTVAQETVGTVSATGELGSQGEPLYRVQETGLGETLLTVEGPGYQHSMKLTVLLPEIALYNRPIRSPATYVGTEMEYDEYRNGSLWLLQEDGMYHEVAQRCTIQTTHNGQPITAGVCNAVVLPDGSSGVRIDLFYPTTPDGYMLHVLPIFQHRVDLHVKPHPVMRRAGVTGNIMIEFLTEEVGTAYIVRYEHGQMMELVTDELGQVSPPYNVCLPWGDEPGSVTVVYAVRKDLTPMCVPLMCTFQSSH